MSQLDISLYFNNFLVFLLFFFLFIIKIFKNFNYFYLNLIIRKSIYSTDRFSNLLNLKELKLISSILKL
uniref:ATP synthase F0 subunit 8 n=1 Tax=Hydra sinensis TaxID=570418 RepID=R4IXA6_9CNID|nr:ATP synthase F0 subunit 8 [Hydra sinensis]AGE65895.1 ATP synthase F0 subunit 8 [Hydra sinensis]